MLAIYRALIYDYSINNGDGNDKQQRRARGADSGIGSVTPLARTLIMALVDLRIARNKSEALAREKTQ